MEKLPVGTATLYWGLAIGIIGGYIYIHLI
jgi:hypothetical protein